MKKSKKQRAKSFRQILHCLAKFFLHLKIRFNFDYFYLKMCWCQYTDLNIVVSTKKFILFKLENGPINTETPFRGSASILWKLKVSREKANDKRSASLLFFFSLF